MRWVDGGRGQTEGKVGWAACTRSSAAAVRRAEGQGHVAGRLNERRQGYRGGEGHGSRPMSKMGAHCPCLTLALTRRRDFYNGGGAHRRARSRARGWWTAAGCCCGEVQAVRCGGVQVQQKRVRSRARGWWTAAGRCCGEVTTLRAGVISGGVAQEDMQQGRGRGSWAITDSLAAGRGEV